MRTLFEFRFPVQEFNAAVKAATIGEKIQKILEFIKPEAIYFTDINGQRGCMMVVDVKESSQIPSICEPFFLVFNADVKVHICMTPDDLSRSGLEELGKKWSV